MIEKLIVQLIYGAIADLEVRKTSDGDDVSITLHCGKPEVRCGYCAEHL